MSPSFQQYTYSERAIIAKLLPIPKSNDYLAIGRKMNKALVLRLNSQLELVWERELEYQGQVIYLVHGASVDDGSNFYFNLLGSVQTGPRRRRHLLIQIDPDSANVMNVKTLHHTTTRLASQLLPMGNGELMITGWNEGSGDQVEVNRVVANLSSASTRRFDMGADDQMTCTTYYANGAIIAGGRRQGTGWEGFLLTVDTQNNTSSTSPAQAYRVHLPGVGVHEIDAILPASSQGFVVAIEARNQDVFFGLIGFNAGTLIGDIPLKCNLGQGVGVRKMIWKNGFVYALCYETSGAKRSFVIKVDPDYNANPASAIQWVKSFQLNQDFVITDINTTTDGFLLCGATRSGGNYDQPLLVSTDEELQCCCTESWPTPVAQLHNKALLMAPLPVNQDEPSSSVDSPGLQANALKAQVEDLCAPNVNKGTCRPALVAWNTLEARSRSRDLSKPLQAQIRDGMWMLSRQWQWGGFAGEDGGSIVYSKLSCKHTNIDRYTQLPGNAMMRPYNGESPLEYQVEKRPVHLSRDYLLRLEAGKYWQKLIRHHFSADSLSGEIAAYQAGFLATYAFTLPQRPPDTNEDDLVAYLQLVALEDTWAVLHAANGRLVDGALLLADILAGTLLSQSFIQAPHQPTLIKVLADFNAWYKENYFDDEAPAPAWSTSALEHRFVCTAPSTQPSSSLVHLQGGAYPGGHLDWYSVDAAIRTKTYADATGLSFQNATIKDAVEVRIPAQLSFPGMPNPRWWAMEDDQVDFGDLLVNKTDLSKMLLMDFILNYADNWYLVPLQLEVGTTMEIEGIEVRDNFGIRTLVRPANTLDREETGSTSDWGLFQLSSLATEDTPDSFLFLPPSTAVIQESKPAEAVNFIRDEMANMVWGIETVIPDGLNTGTKGQEASRATQQLFPTVSLSVNATGTTGEKPILKYQLATTIDENWIPFIPVHSGDDFRSIQLQRARMPRTLGGFSNYVSARTQLIGAPTSPLLIHEEEVPRAGKIIAGTWQRTRWMNGKTFVWYGYKATTGRGSQSSGLKFDQLR